MEAASVAVRLDNIDFLERYEMYTQHIIKLRPSACAPPCRPCHSVISPRASFVYLYIAIFDAFLFKISARSEYMAKHSN